MYKKDQVYKATLKYFNGDELATSVWIDKYCLKNNGNLLELTPNDMHRRLAKEFARIEKKYENPLDEDEIYELLKDFKYIIPQGSPMAGIGNNNVNTSISNCFVIGNHVDSYGGIMKSDEEQVQLMKRRGGVGQDISYIRPSGAVAGKTKLGPNAGTHLYMSRFSNTTKEVQQDGRRGALMLSIDVKHPDVEKFIDKKMNPNSVTGANVSVKISDEFIKAVKNDSYFIQMFPVKLNRNDILGDRVGKFEFGKLFKGEVINGIQTYFKFIKARKIWKKIIHNAWSSAEPGILFWDNILRESPANYYGVDWKETSTNPCGEIPLPPNDSCRLLVLNLYSYVTSKFERNSKFDFNLLSQHVKKAMRLMDDIVDLEIEKIDKILTSIDNKIHDKQYQRVEKELWLKIRKKAVDGRRTGLGITGEADMLAALGFIYGTEGATSFSEIIHKSIAVDAYKSSGRLAEERGCFPIWHPNDISSSTFLKRVFKAIGHIDTYRRNIGILTIAPAGSVSILTQTSSGVEPIFSPWYFRKKKVEESIKYDHRDNNGDCWKEYRVFHKQFITWYGIYLQLTEESALEQLLDMSADRLDKLFKLSPYYKATSRDVDYIEKVRMQGLIQRWVDHSISVTVNMPENVDEDTVEKVYMKAYTSKCKGITVYRENSRGNVLSTKSIKKVADNNSFDYISAIKRPRRLECDIYFKSSMKNPFIILVGKLEDKPYEVFAVPYNDKTKFSKTIKNGNIVKISKRKYVLVGEDDMPLIDDITSHMIETEENETRSISGLLRHRVDPKFIIKMISKFATISSFHKVIEKVLTIYLKDGDIKCPKCDGKITMTEGCMKCVDCGYAQCG